jgi:hypothetical protein
LKRWEGIQRDGSDLPCTEEEKKAFINNPQTSRLAQYIMDQTDSKARELHGVDDE